MFVYQPQTPGWIQFVSRYSRYCVLCAWCLGFWDACPEKMAEWHAGECAGSVCWRLSIGLHTASLPVIQWASQKFSEPASQPSSGPARQDHAKDQYQEYQEISCYVTAPAKTLAEYGRRKVNLLFPFCLLHILFGANNNTKTITDTTKIAKKV